MWIPEDLDSMPHADLVSLVKTLRAEREDMEYEHSQRGAGGSSSVPLASVAKGNSPSRHGKLPLSKNVVQMRLSV